MAVCSWLITKVLMLNNYTTPVQVAMGGRDEVTELLEIGVLVAELEESLLPFPSPDISGSHRFLAA